MPVLSIIIVLNCFYLLIFYFEKFSTHVCRSPYAANVNLNLSNEEHYGNTPALIRGLGLTGSQTSNMVLSVNSTFQVEGPFIFYGLVGAGGI